MNAPRRATTPKFEERSRISLDLRETGSVNERISKSDITLANDKPLTEKSGV